MIALGTANLRKFNDTGDEKSSGDTDDRVGLPRDGADHSSTDARELIVGYSITGRLLLESFAEQPGSMLRLISARVATKRERQDHEDNLKS